VFSIYPNSVVKIDLQLVSPTTVASWVMNAISLTVWCCRYPVLVDGILKTQNLVLFS
jgi:hypothetical protein